ncbi:MAG: TCP-1/cpn60 chaperonin family protein [Dehalococcoidia bacterium]|jgi:chaperonin GroEL
METRVLSDRGRISLINGAKLAASVIGSTMGPAGRYVAIEYRGNVPEMTKDGVSVSSKIFLHDPVEEMGNELVKMACLKTLAKTSDGTTTTAVLVGALAETLSGAMDGRPSAQVIEGAKQAVTDVQAKVREESVPFSPDDALKVAVVSANSRELGTLAYQAFDGDYDLDVQVELSNRPTTEVSVSRGLRIPAGYHSDRFVNMPDIGACILEDVAVLASDSVIEDVDSVTPAVSAVAVARNGGSGVTLLVVAEGFSEAVSGALTRFASQGIPVLAVKAVASGSRCHEICGDIAALGGGVAYGDKSGRDMRDFTLGTAPRFGRVYANRNFCDVMGSGHADSEAVKTRLAAAQKSLSETESDFEKAHFGRRVRGLKFRFAYLSVGGVSDAERHENGQRIEDAVGAVKAAMVGGTVIGCGQALYNAATELGDLSGMNDDFAAGYEAVLMACDSPRRQILLNAGLSEDEINAPSGVEIDPITMMQTDFRLKGILDPTEVPCVALENAVSVAILIANTLFSVSYMDRVGPYAK